SAFTGEEEDITTSREALTTDDGLRVTVNAIVPPREDVVLAIEEAGAPGRLLHFPDGSTTTHLTNGINERTIVVRGTSTDAARRVTLRAQTTSGATAASIELRLKSAGATTSPATVLFAAPSPAILSPAHPTVQLSIGAGLQDGRTVNVTGSASGTRYVVEDARVAT